MTVVVLCDAADEPRIPDGGEVLRVRSQGAEARNLRLADMAEMLPGRVPDRAKDLAALAGYVYWADQMVARGGDTDVFGDGWSRQFEVHAPVRDVPFWRRDEVSAALSEALYAGTGDTWRFRFFEASPGEEQFVLPDTGFQPHDDADCVLMFSGGADSLASAIKAVRVDGLHPVLVSHSPNHRTTGRQRKLIDALNAVGNPWRFLQVPFEVNKPARTEKESTQRTRGFLYASMGAATAAGLRLRDVIMSDNGIVSLGLPPNAGVVGSMASRTTHTMFFGAMNRLLSWVAPGIRVRNTLWNQTRADALGLLRTHQCEHLLKLTHSCAAGWALSDDKPHCGRCSQCIDRRVGVVAKGLEAFDSGYAHDVFRDDLEGPALTLGEALVRSAHRVAQWTTSDVPVELPEVLDCLNLDATDAEAYLVTVCEMVLRQGNMMRLALGLERRRPDVVFGAHSLLGLAGAEHPTTSTAQVPASGPPSLSADARLAMKRYGLRSELRIEITGEDGKATLVEVEGREVRLTPAYFVVFLRLVVALFEKPNAYELLGDEGEQGLALEEWFEGDLMEGAINKLRERFHPFLGGTKHTDFIQISDRRVRLSTLPELVSFDRPWLLEHRNPWVRQFAARLPEQSTVRSRPA